jgi:hypothetical protein
MFFDSFFWLLICIAWRMVKLYGENVCLLKKFSAAFTRAMFKYEFVYFLFGISMDA